MVNGDNIAAKNLGDYIDKDFQKWNGITVLP